MHIRGLCSTPSRCCTCVMFTSGFKLDLGYGHTKQATSKYASTTTSTSCCITSSPTSSTRPRLLGIDYFVNLARPETTRARVSTSWLHQQPLRLPRQLLRSHQTSTSNQAKSYVLIIFSLISLSCIYKRESSCATRAPTSSCVFHSIADFFVRPMENFPGSFLKTS